MAHEKFRTYEWETKNRKDIEKIFAVTIYAREGDEFIPIKIEDSGDNDGFAYLSIGDRKMKLRLKSLIDVFRAIGSADVEGVLRMFENKQNVMSILGKKT